MYRAAREMRWQLVPKGSLVVITVVTVWEVSFLYVPNGAPLEVVLERLGPRGWSERILRRRRRMMKMTP
jgi:hypothetical protein